MTDKIQILENHFDLSKFKSVYYQLDQRLSAFYSSTYFKLIIVNYTFPTTSILKSCIQNDYLSEKLLSGKLTRYTVSVARVSAV
jgi:hypothetical protein